MRLTGLLLLLILSYFFNPVQPIVASDPVIDFTTIDDTDNLEYLDASTIYLEELEITA